MLSLLADRVQNHSMTQTSSHFSRNASFQRRGRSSRGGGDAAKRRQDKLRQARQAAAIAAASQPTSVLQSEGGDTKLRLSYKVEVKVDHIVRVKGPEKTSNGYDIHVWVREGRQTKHHTVSTRSAAEAQQWIEQVQAAKGRSMTEHSLSGADAGSVGLSGLSHISKDSQQELSTGL